MPACLHGSQDCCIQCPWWPTPLPETPGDSQTSLAQSLVGSLLHSPGSWCTQGFICALQKSVSPILWKFCNQIPLTFKAKFPGGFSVPLPDLRVGKSVVGPRSFATVQELFWYNYSPVCRSSAQWVYGGVNGDLLQEDLCYTSHLPGLLQPELQSLRQVTADLCLCRRHSNIQSRSGSVSCGGHCSFPWVLVCTRFSLCPLSISDRCEVWFYSKCNFTPPTVLLRCLLCPWTRGIWF